MMMMMMMICYKLRLFQFFNIQVLCSTHSGYAKPINMHDAHEGKQLLFKIKVS